MSPNPTTITIVDFIVVRSAERADNSEICADGSIPSVRSTRIFWGLVELVTVNTLSFAYLSAFVRLVVSTLNASAFSLNSCTAKSVDRELRLLRITWELNVMNPASLPVLWRMLLIRLLTRSTSLLKLS